MQFMHHPGYMASNSVLPELLDSVTICHEFAHAGHGAATDGDDAAAWRGLVWSTVAAFELVQTCSDNPTSHLCWMLCSLKAPHDAHGHAGHPAARAVPWPVGFIFDKSTGYSRQTLG